MKKFFILLGGIFVLNSSITLRCFSEDKPGTPVTVVGPNQKTFEAKCSMCHGKDGKGKEAMAKSFKVDTAALNLTSKTVADKKDEELTAIITNGKNKMPAYGKQLSPAAVNGLVTYIRSLTPKSK